jgi:GH25 family lysozyme M1 (1,4-beta-N-acetylmuramidase)
MKKLFNHTKRPVEDWKGYDENDYDWDKSDYDSYEGDEENYEDEAFLEEGEFLEQESYYIEEQGEEPAAESEYYVEEELSAESGEYVEEGFAAEPEDYVEEEPAAESGEYVEEGFAAEPEDYVEEEPAAEPEDYVEEEFAAESGDYVEEEFAAKPEYYMEEDFAVEPGEYLEEKSGSETWYNGEAETQEEIEYYGEAEYCGAARTGQVTGCDKEKKHCVAAEACEEIEYYVENYREGIEIPVKGGYYREESIGEPERCVREETGTCGEPEYYEETEIYGEPEQCEEAVTYGESEQYEEAFLYGEPERYEEALPYGEPGQYEEALSYGESGQYEEALSYGESGQYEEAWTYGESGQYEEALPYGEPEHYEEALPYGESGQYEEALPYGEPERYEEASPYGEPEYYEETVSRGGQEYYEENVPYEESRPYKEKRSIFDKLRKESDGAGIMDKVILGTGAAVLILAIIIGGVFIRSKIAEGQVADFAGVGSQLDGINVIGERGLLAVADAELARMAAAEAVQEQEKEPPKEYNEADYEKDVTVSLSLTSVQKDLKIKFINSSNGKLISNVPFSVTVTGADGKSVIWTDDDMDGIIYKKDLVPGSYTVVMQLLADEQYSDYNISETPQKVEVKKDIDYKKVDVTNEIKKESEINAAKEDTKQNVTVVESSLPDTIEWVESKVIESTYNEVSKSSIPDPATLVSAAVGGTLINVAEVRTTVSGNIPMQGSLTLDRTEVTLLTETNATVNAVLTGITTAAPTVTAASADPNIAMVSAAGTVVTVTGVNAGSTAVTVGYMENGQFLTQNFQVTVKSHPKSDYETKLKDTEGNQLFVLDNEVYREAVYADYYTADKFFVRGGAKYSGWQTLDGKVYYFTASGEMVTGEQVIQGARYNFASDGSLVTGSGTMGIDVSKWNGNIDWNAVSNSGISYVIIRCGYRGSSQGKLIEDPKFLANIKGATAAGLKVGVYFFTQAVDEVEAVEEASMVLEQIKGYKISYPIFLDVEPSGGRADSIDRDTRTAVCKAFCETIQDAGYTAGIYANKTWLTGKLNAGELNAYKIWLAQYSATPTYTGKYDIWQYKSNGSVSGIKGNVDMNQSYLGY